MLLVDGDDLVELLAAFDGVVLAGGVAGAVQALADGAVEDVEHQRGFPGPGYTRHRDQQAQRQAHGDVLQVVLARAADGDGFAAGRAAALRDRDGRPPGQVIPGERAGLRGDFGRRAGRDHLPAVLAGAWAEVDHVIRGGDHLQVVFDDQDGVAQVAQAAQDADQAAGVALVQPDGRLVEDVEHAAQARAEQGSQAQALGLTGREGRRSALQGQVTGADFDQPGDALAQIGQDRPGDEHFVRAEDGGEAAQPGAEIGRAAGARAR